MVSEATVNFFTDIHRSSSRVMKILEETHNERSHHLANFEKKFKVSKYLRFLSPDLFYIRLMVDFLQPVTGRGCERGRAGLRGNCSNFGSLDF